MIRFYLEERDERTNLQGDPTTEGEKRADFAWSSHHEEPRWCCVIRFCTMSSLQHGIPQVAMWSGVRSVGRPWRSGTSTMMDTLQLQLQINKAKVSSSRVISMLRYERKEWRKKTASPMVLAWLPWLQPWMRKKVDERGGLGEGGVERNRAPRARKSKQRQGSHGRPSLLTFWLLWAFLQKQFKNKRFAGRLILQGVFRKGFMKTWMGLELGGFYVIWPKSRIQMGVWIQISQFCFDVWPATL